jgi:hypothetical protein
MILDNINVLYSFKGKRKFENNQIETRFDEGTIKNQKIIQYKYK